MIQSAKMAQNKVVLLAQFPLFKVKVECSLRIL